MSISKKVIDLPLQWWNNVDDWLRRSREMLILIEGHNNISVQTVAYIVKHEDPQINSVRGVFNNFALR